MKIEIQAWESRWWMPRVEWMISNEPGRIENLFLRNRPLLISSLDETVTLAIRAGSDLRKRGDLEPHEIEERVLREVVAPEAPLDAERKPRKPMADDLADRIRQWAENPKPRGPGRRTM